VEDELCKPLVHELPVAEYPFKQWRQVPDVEQRVVDIECEDRRHHSATLAFLSGCGRSPSDSPPVTPSIAVAPSPASSLRRSIDRTSSSVIGFPLFPVDASLPVLRERSARCRVELERRTHLCSYRSCRTLVRERSYAGWPRWRREQRVKSGDEFAIGGCDVTAGTIRQIRNERERKTSGQGLRAPFSQFGRSGSGGGSGFAPSINMRNIGTAGLQAGMAPNKLCATPLFRSQFHSTRFANDVLIRDCYILWTLASVALPFDWSPHRSGNLEPSTYD